VLQTIVWVFGIFFKPETDMNHRPKAQPSPPVTPFLDSSGAAQFLLAAPQTLANWRLKGEGPVFSKEA
jgi:hypothetical protein